MTAHPKKFKFRIALDAFDTAVELAVDTERMVKSTFTVTLYGYILTEDFDSRITTRVALGPKTVTFEENISLNIEPAYRPSKKVTRYDYDTDITSDIDLDS